MSSIQEYKVVVVGEKGVGKSSFIRRMIDGDFKHEYISTVKEEINRFVFNIHSFGNYTKIVFTVYDSADDYSNVDYAIIMYDANKPDQADISKYIKQIKHDSPNANILIVANKCDLLIGKDFVRPAGSINCMVLVSAKSMYNYDKPWLYIARSLKTDDDLIIV